MREQDEKQAKERINAAHSEQERNFEEKAAEIRLECEQEMQKLRLSLEGLLSLKKFFFVFSEQIETAVAKKSKQFQADLKTKLKEQKQISKIQNQAEIERIKQKELNKFKDALEMMKSENDSKMVSEKDFYILPYPLRGIWLILSSFKLLSEKFAETNCQYSPQEVIMFY